uniref:Immunoglobulin domain-containing protein n=1 Tax=Cyprinus carpio TaxID=7962 RepID=A0A8C1YHV3_CYPCA
MLSVFGDMEKVSVKEGDSLTLHTDVTEIQRIFFLMWMYGSQNIIIAKIDGKTQAVSLYDVDDGRFEDRLQLDNKTGSLSISDIRTKHSGDYHLKIISDETFLKTFSVTAIYLKSFYVIFAGLENKKEGDSVTLHTGVTDSQKHDLIQWTFGPTNPDSLVAEMNIKIHEITFSSDDIYKGRLQLENQTGSLTIRDIRTSDAGVYQLQISNSKETLYKRFSVFVEKKTLSVKEGNSVTLETGAVEIQRENEVLWIFGPQNTVIAQIDKKAGNISYTDDERFRDKLELDNQTGDLTITNTKSTDSGDGRFRDRLQLNQRTGDLTIRNISRAHSDVYTLQITSGKKSTCKRFMVIAHGE